MQSCGLGGMRGNKIGRMCFYAHIWVFLRSVFCTPETVLLECPGKAQSSFLYCLIMCNISIFLYHNIVRCADSSNSCLVPVKVTRIICFRAYNTRRVFDYTSLYPLSAVLGYSDVFSVLITQETEVGGESFHFHDSHIITLYQTKSTMLFTQILF